jgi:diadenosine tetraphosphate (Ap4A) HIT family hydrolase
MSVLYLGDYYPEYQDLEFQIKIEPIITNDHWIYLLRLQKLRESKEWLETMDKAYKKLGKEAKKIEKDTKAVLKKDKSRDKIIDKAKEMKKKGC